MGSRSVTGHRNRIGRDARVILRGASPMVARLDRNRVANGNCAALFPDIRINALSEGYSLRADGRAPAARADAERWAC